MGEPLHARHCVTCGLIDTDPKHIVYFGDRAEAFHYDCHGHGDPECESCAGALKGADGLTGGALRDHLMGGA